MQTSLVTGGAGFIGSHLVERLLERGDRVKVIDDLSGGSTDNLKEVAGDVEMTVGSILDRETLDKAMKNVDQVFHLAARGSVPRSVADPLGTIQVNSVGTLQVLLAARDAETQRLVFSSSSSVYGDNKTLPKRESDTGAVLSPYAVSKKDGEDFCRLFAELYNYPATALRFFNVFGPRQQANHAYAAVIPRFCSAITHGSGEIEIHGDGHQSRDFTYVDDNISGILAIVSAPTEKTAGNVYNLACGRTTSLLGIVETLEQITGEPIQRRHTLSRPGDIRDSFADITALQRVSEYRPSLTIEEGLRRTLEWARHAG